MTSTRGADDPVVCEVVTFATLGNDAEMKFSTWAAAARRGRDAFQRAFPVLAPKIRRPMPGGFQPYNFTLPDRYPWLFRFAAAELAERQHPRILSFGCSRGEEPFTLRRYFPTAQIKGIDVDPRNIAACEARARAENAVGMTFVTAAGTEDEPTESFDAVFCLAVLCLGDLTTSGAQRCDPYLYFDRFEATVTDFARCLKPGGLLLLHTANFRFCDTAAARRFDTLLEAEPQQMAPDVVFDRHNQLMSGESYRAVGFRKQ
jgi:SAM-dependent methyltransferase